MLNIISSKAAKPSDLLREDKRIDGEDNLQWLSRHLPADGESANLVLVGGTSPAAFRLRVAQSHLRHDLAPSHWSHVMLLGKPAKNFTTTRAYEISLEPPEGFGFPPPTNGRQEGRVGRYRDPDLYPNIAVLTAPVPLKQILDTFADFEKQRAVLDCVDLIVRWLAFVWGVARSGNPLLDGQGMPSAAMLEVVFGVAGYDLTPGLESRSGCPEAIYQAAKWWHEYYEGQDRVALAGAYLTGHKL